MKTNKILRNLLKKQKEISSPPSPNEIGFLTPLYRSIIVYFKVAPYRWLVPLAFIFTLMLYFVFRSKVVWLVTILQKGF